MNGHKICDPWTLAFSCRTHIQGETYPHLPTLSGVGSLSIRVIQQMKACFQIAAEKQTKAL